MQTITISEQQKKCASCHITCSVLIQHWGPQAFQSHPSSFFLVSFPLLIFPVSSRQKNYSLFNSQSSNIRVCCFFFFLSMKQFVLHYLFPSPNIYILIFSRSEPQTTYAGSKYYTHLGAEGDGQPLDRIVADQHIQTQ